MEKVLTLGLWCTITCDRRRKIAKRKIKRALSKRNAKNRKYPWLKIAEVEVLSSGGYFDSEGVLHNSEDCPRCTGTIGSTGKRCRNFSVQGSTVCRIHGGLLVAAEGKKMRLYSAFIQDPTLAKVYENAMDSQEIAGINEELSLLRTLLADLIKKTTVIGVKEVKDIASVIGEIRQLVNDTTKTQIKLGQLIDVGKITVIVHALAKIIAKHEKDEEIIQKISHDFDELIWPAPFASAPQPERENALSRLPALPEAIS
jgi:hypothetical protein